MDTHCTSLPLYYQLPWFENFQCISYYPLSFPNYPSVLSIAVQYCRMDIKLSQAISQTQHPQPLILDPWWINCDGWSLPNISGILNYLLQIEDSSFCALEQLHKLGGEQSQRLFVAPARSGRHPSALLALGIRHGARKMATVSSLSGFLSSLNLEPTDTSKIWLVEGHVIKRVWHTTTW